MIANADRKYRIIEFEATVDGKKETVRGLFVDDLSLLYKSDILKYYPELHVYDTDTDTEDEDIITTITELEDPITNEIIITREKLDSKDNIVTVLYNDSWDWGFLDYDELLTIGEFAAGKAEELE